MSASPSTTSVARSLDGTAGQDSGTRAAVYEFRVFNMVILSLAVCIVAVTAVVCCASYYSRRRRYKCARANESTAGPASGAGHADATGTWKRRSFRNPLALLRRQQEPSRDNSRIYYIYSNPLPVGHPEDEPSTSRAPAARTLLALQDHASDSERGVVLDPPTFYMQL
ncbi:uncharacterized protein [Salminus brasiliensis]|uniref:uncharacterized protein n=1 Tax=Salminus brasiliensis TaxID=930266 RepID=UPI003B833BD7